MVVVVVSDVEAGDELDSEVTVVVDVGTGAMIGVVPLAFELELELSVDTVVLALLAVADEEPEVVGSGTTTGTVVPALLVCADVDSLEAALDGADDCELSAVEVGDELAVAGPTTTGLVAVAKEVTLDVATAGGVYGEKVVLAKNEDNAGNSD